MCGTENSFSSICYKMKFQKVFRNSVLRNYSRSRVRLINYIPVCIRKETHWATSELDLLVKSLITKGQEFNFHFDDD